jgi:hypothetical protein
MRAQKITLGEMRSGGTVGILIYCRDHAAAITSKPTLTAGAMMFG